MKITYQISKILNVMALLCLLVGQYGLPFTGILQILAAFFFLIAFPKSKLIYTYFTITSLFFISIKTNVFELFSPILLVPIVLIFFLSYIVHFKKLGHEI